MIRKIVHIDSEQCTGCGACAQACHEGAIAMVEGRARLLRDDYCDGLGDCLPACPAGAISIELREAAAYDETAVAAHRIRQASQGLRPDPAAAPCSMPAGGEAAPLNWPVQLKLAPVQAPFFQGADLLVAADCTGYACPQFHAWFAGGRTLLIGCPKLDRVDYTEKLAALLARNSISSVLLTRMEVPCCGGLEAAVEKAIRASGKDLPLRVVTLSTGGQILADRSQTP